MPVVRGGGQAAAHMAVVGLLSLARCRSRKGWTRRPRPFRACPGVIAHVPPLDEFSFPSGHTLQAVGFTLVALSRVVLGLHYPSDMLAACVIGGLLGGLSLFARPGLALLV